MNEPLDVLCVGETMVMVTPQDAEPLAAGSLCLLSIGGAESNVATHLAGMGHRTAWAGIVGDDALGTVVIDELASAGVDVTRAQRHPSHPTAVYFKNPSPGGTTVHYYRTGSAATTMSADTVTGWPETRPRLIHVSGITAALSADCRDLLRALTVDRVIDGALVSFDVNHRPALWPNGDAAEVLTEFAAASDIVFVGLDEAERVWGTTTVDELRAVLPDVAHIVVKDGGHDATELVDGKVTVVAAPTVEVVEAVGAGDAFAAGWTAGLLRGLSAEGRLRLGHLMASRVLGSPTDAAPAPSAEQITRALATDPAQWALSIPSHAR